MNGKEDPGILKKTGAEPSRTLLGAVMLCLVGGSGFIFLECVEGFVDVTEE